MYFKVSRLSRIGGTSTSKSVYNILHWMITEEIALKIRYTDQSGKISFGNRISAKLVRGKKFSTNKTKLNKFT